MTDPRVDPKMERMVSPEPVEDPEPVAEPAAAQHRPAPVDPGDERVFEDGDVERFREQWRELQAGFVDEPKGAVREADSLVSQMMDTFTAQLTERKRALAGEWDGDVDTEALRVALRRYRALFDQMLAVR